VPGPLDGGYTLHGGRRVCHSDAKMTRIFGSEARSIAPVSRSRNSVRVHVAPPSVER
jgi:hypothetical protein